MRRRAVGGEELFQRPSWEPELVQCSLSLRLLNRLAWGEAGLTMREREVLALIAAGGHVDGVALQPRRARSALQYPWLDGRLHGSDSTQTRQRRTHDTRNGASGPHVDETALRQPDPDAYRREFDSENRPEET